MTLDTAAHSAHDGAMNTDTAPRYWTQTFCTESRVQRTTPDGWETVQVFRGIDHQARAAEALRRITEEAR